MVARPAGHGGSAGALPQGCGCDAALRQLEDELHAAQQDLESTIEKLQTVNEELRVSNEELTTVNGQLQEKVERLDTANSDSANLLQSTQIATLFLDAELRIKSFTPVTTRILKLIPTDMGRPISDLSAPLVDYDLTADARAVTRGGAATEREVRHADGSSYLVRVLPYLARDGQVAGVVATFSDVTQVRRAQEQTQRLATVLSDSNDAVILFDLAGRILVWNRGAEQLYGWSGADAVQMNIRDLAPPDRAASSDELIRRLTGGETITSSETQRRTKDGRVLEVWQTITAVRDEVGTVAAIAATERDITERKATEQYLQAMAGQLARSNKDLEHFAYVASHDLQEPLRMVTGFLGLLKDRYQEKLDEKAREWILHAVDGAKRMSDLIDDLLAYSRVDRKGQKSVPTSAQKALERALALLRPSIEESGAKVTHDLSAAALAGKVPRHGRRSGDLQADRRTARRSDLGRVERRRGGDVLLHAAGSRRRLRMNGAALRDDPA